MALGVKGASLVVEAETHWNTLGLFNETLNHLIICFTNDITKTLDTTSHNRLNVPSRHTGVIIYLSLPLSLAQS